jgi:hypothetical protein
MNKVTILIVDLRSSGLLRSVVWQLLTDVSGQPIRHIFKDQESKKYKDFDSHLPQLQPSSYQSQYTVIGDVSFVFPFIAQSTTYLNTFTIKMLIRNKKCMFHVT